MHCWEFKFVQSFLEDILKMSINNSSVDSFEFLAISILEIYYIGRQSVEKYA